MRSMPATKSAIDKLRDNLAVGLGIFSRIWDYKTKDWVTSVCAGDVDKDGKAEVVVCTREGRIFFLTSDKGGDRWERVVGDKTDWIGTATIIGGVQPRIIIGKRDGKIYCLDKDGNTITRDGRSLPFNKKDGRAEDEKAEEEAYWFQAGDVIRQVCFDEYSSLIIIGSEDRRVYGLDSSSGKRRWEFATDDWVQTVSVFDINHDDVPEILVGSADKFLYILNLEGQMLARHDMKFPVQSIVAEDVDQDGSVEILVSTDGKDLAAIVYESSGSFIEKWRIPLNNRVLSLCAVDIDNDKKIEIIASSEDEHTYLFDDQGGVIWRHNHNYRVYSLFPYDIDNDGLPELLMGSDDNVIRAMRIRLYRDVDRKIRDFYKRLGKPEPDDIKGLSQDEQNLLEDILGSKKIEQATLYQANEFMRSANYIQALLTLLQLQQQHEQPLWSRDDIGHIRTLSLRKIKNDPTQEIIIGNTEGRVQAFKANRKLLWSKRFDNRIIDIQTGYINRSKQEDIVLCSSDRHVYILSGAGRREPRKSLIQTHMSSLSVVPSRNQHTAQIIIGSEEKKLYALDSDLKGPAETIDTEGIEGGIRIVRTQISHETQRPEIVVGSLDNHIYAYMLSGRLPWIYQTYDHILSICLKDIDADGNIEVLIGSEDRNIHVLDNAGQLLWRYYLPDSVLSVDAADADLDGNIEIFVGCGDGYLYVFNRVGDFLWKYRAHDRIHALRVDDINGDGLVEIALGAEDRLELLQVVNPSIIHKMIEECWSALCEEQSAPLLMSNLLRNSNPFLRAFALQKLSEQVSFSVHDFELLEQFVKDHDVEMRKALVHVALERYPLSPAIARRLLETLRVDLDEDVINTLAVSLPALTKHDWESSLGYLKHFAENDNRYVRRQAVRVVHQLIDFQLEITIDNQRKIFELLLKALLDGIEWVRQEAARTMAHFLDRYHERLIVDVQMFLMKEVQEEILRHIASAASTPIIKRYLEVIISMLSDLNDENVLEKTRQGVRLLELEEASHLKFGKDLHLIYSELYLLLTINTINELAQYQFQLKMSQFVQGNQFVQIIMDVFKELSSISRVLRIYLRRDSLPDQLSSLLEAKTTIERVQKFLEEPYSRQLKGESVTKLPDHQIFLLLLHRWHTMVDIRLKDLGGKAELKAELMAKQIRYEDQVGIWLALSNMGRSSASNVKVSLLHNDNFAVIGKRTFEFETIAPQDKKQVEFIIGPKTPTLNLRFEVIYDDAERAEKAELFEDRLELSKSRQEFRPIPNPYTTGTPIQDSKMFFGREADMAYLKDNLSREAKTVIILYAHRRYGKTTLLLQMTNAGVMDKHIPVLIDMQGISYHINIHKFLYRVAFAIAQAMKKNHLSICAPKLSDFADNPTHDFIVFLNGLEEALGERKLILLIDEFEVLEDQVAKGNLEPEIFEYLRDILQHRQNINFLFSGAHKIIEHTRYYSSTFFNIARHYQLTRLNKEGAEALIQQPVADFLEYEPLTIAKIHQLTNDQPYLIHLMCRAIIDYCNNKRKTYVTINDVNAVLLEVMQTIHYYFNWLWDQVSPQERVILSALAEGGKEDGHWLTLDELIELYQRFNIPFRKEILLDCLRKLIDFDIVENQASDPRDTVLDSSRFRIPVGLIRRWLLREWPLGLVRSQIIQ
jgi:outer membrane protein assembly factor BamB